MIGRPLLVAAVVFATLLPLAPARAADTIETFDPGYTDVEFYAGFDGAGRRGYHQSVTGDFVAAWGLADRFSTFLGTTFQADGYLTDGQAQLAGGAFGTLRDGDHLDLDVILDFSTVSGGDGGLAVNPSFELNLDHAPDMSTHGAYLRGGVSLAGRMADDRPERMADWAVAVGAYRTLAPGRQLLIEVDGAMVDTPDGGHAWENGVVALGYNHVLSDALELINQVTLDLPRDGQASGVGMMVGVIATLPGGGF